MKLGMYIMAPEPISTVCFTNPSYQPVSLYVYSPIVARQRLGKHVPTIKNTRNNRIIVGCVVLYTVGAVSREGLCIPNSNICSVETVV
jgi:hypothetical protein